MKNRILLAVMLLLASGLNAQVPFNETINGTSPAKEYHNYVKMQTITHDQSDNIVLWSYNPSTSQSFEVIKLTQTGSFITSYKFVKNNNYDLYPQNIINTYDDGFIITGVYVGIAPSQYPTPPGVPGISTLFYAKLDNNLNLITFNLHYNSWYNDGTLEVFNIATSDIDNDAIDEYVICRNDGDGAGGTETRLVMLDDNLNPLFEKRLPLLESKIDYLPNNNLFAITGILGDYGQYCIGLLDATLNLVTPLKVLPRSYNPIPATSGVIEEGNDPTKIIWSFAGTASTELIEQSPCDIGASLYGSIYIIKMDVNTLNNIKEREFTGNCAYFTLPVAIHNGAISGSDEFALGINQTKMVVDPISNNPVPDTKGALMILDYDLNLNTSYVYNPQDIVNYYYYAYDLRYFCPFNGAMGPSYLLNLSWPSTNYTRIINAQSWGEAECSDPQDMVYVDHEDELANWDEIALDLEVLAVDINEQLVDQLYNINYCGTAPRPTNINVMSSKSDIRIYPNPITNSIVNIEGKLLKESFVEISDIAGRKVFTHPLSDNEKNVVKLPELSSGIYNMAIWSSGTLVKREKLSIY